MKLVLKNKGENFDLEIFPEDTFLDIQNRILEDGRIILDIAKLASPNKPFTMSANVVDYFGIEKNPNSEAIATLVSKINMCVENSQESSFNQTYSTPAEKDVEKYNEFPLEGSASSDSVVSEEQIIKNGDELSNAFQINLENVPFPGKSLYSSKYFFNIISFNVILYNKIKIKMLLFLR